MIVGPTRSWSYAELHVYTEAVVGALRREGLGLGDRAILAAEACPEAIAVILACSMLGVVFVPTTPDLPTARLRAIAETTSAALVITSNDAELDLDALDATEVQPGTLERLVIGRRRSASPRGAAGAKPLGSDLAYIIFTSGTTGRPKGIMMSHGAAVTFFRGLVEHAAIGPGERIGSIAPLSFDFSLLDMGLALGVGATLVQVPRALPHAPRRLVEYLDHHEVSMMNCVPSVWRLVVQHAADALSGLAGRLHSTLVAGEGFPMPYLRRLREALPSLRIINCFGQSESIASSFADVPLPLAPDELRELLSLHADAGGGPLSSGELQQLIEQAQARGIDAVRRPQAVAGLQPTATARTFYFDPSFTLDLSTQGIEWTLARILQLVSDGTFN